VQLCGRLDRYDDGIAMYRSSDICVWIWANLRCASASEWVTIYFNVNRDINPTDGLRRAAAFQPSAEKAKDPKS
jgi:hypothetical protein